MKKAVELVAEAKAKIENLDVAGVDKERAAGVLLVDLREPAELAESGRIAGSVNVPRGMLEFRADPTSPYHQEGFEPERRIILHCATGGRSALAAAALTDMGYTNVAHLDGGFKAWVAAGRPVESATTAAR
ncbi:MAG: rhodanese-like domain-containing protein [Chloroflexota bacterium]|jgi:rhodanese-related sulfurtransferase